MDTQYAHFRGNPLCQATKATDKQLKVIQNERNLGIITIKYIYDLVPKGVHENRTKEVENKVDDTLKLVVFLESAQC